MYSIDHSPEARMDAAICFVAAAKWLEENEFPWGQKYNHRATACYAISKATNDIKLDEHGRAVHRAIWDTFHALFLEDNKAVQEDICVYDGLFWPDDEEGYNTRIVSLLFAAHFVLES